MKVYIITKGEYSDYHICAVTDDPEKAKLLKEAMSDDCDYANIEEYDTDDIQVNAYLDKNNIEYCVALDAKTGLIECKANWKLSDPYGISSSEVWETHEYQEPSGRLVYKTVVYAENEEKATKIASDRFAKYKAEKENL